ncbi:outer membrane beta-barrel family protein [Sphingobacterium tabacisoli]|uniref:Outer membrane beta-barrel protein n=1 Tax=Sphingobacterium tabacisoli TaxID=2044855 RepID=A0ABW5L9K0_9SPHI|nr:outer membrane beta-barrel family protein [Sphingobacterium tabacisoli]
MYTTIKFHITLCFILLMANQSFAQNAIKGKIVDENNMALPGATILLINNSDSTEKQLHISDANGSFVFNSKDKSPYRIEVSFINYKKLIYTIESKETVAKELLLKMFPEETLLSTVTVMGKKKALSVKGGKTTMTVENSPLAQSQSAFDLLKNLPGVNVGKDGDIKIKGKAGVVVMIDGEPVEMGDSQLKNLLKATPGTTLKSIEIMNHPPASMDASGNAGVINFTFKKNAKQGTNGTFSSGIGYGKYVKTDHSLSLAHGTEKWNFNALYAYDYDHSWEKETVFRRTEINNDYVDINQLQLNPEKSKGHLAKFGVDRIFDGKNTLGVQLTYNNIWNPTKGNTTTSIARPSSVETTHQENILSNKINNWDGILKYQHKFNDDKLLKSSFQVTVLDLQSKDNRIIKQDLLLQNKPESSEQRSVYPIKVNKFTFKVDYSEKLSESWKFETGFKSNYTKINSSQKSEQYSGGTWSEDPLHQNNFQYKEAIQSAYGLFEMNKEKWHMRGGLRGELTTIKGQSASEKSLVNQNYLSLFPDLEIGYKPNESYNVTLNYNRRVDRPDYDQLNPSVKYLDIYTIEKGNPNLAPQFSNNIELNQQLFQFIDIAVEYSRLKNPIYYSLNTDDPIASYYTNINTDSQNRWSASLSFPIPGVRWWENYQSVYVYTTAYNISSGENQLKEKGKSLGLYSFNSFKLPYKVNMEITGWYENGGLYSNFRYRPMAEVNIGVNRKFISDKLSVGISASDLFYNSIFKANIVSSKDEIYNLDSRSDSRIFKLNLSWTFGGKTKEKADVQFDKNDNHHFPTNRSRVNIKP